jgi:hypothetical protein
MSIRIPLDRIVPDVTFSGSIEEIKQKANDIVDTYESQIPQVPQIPQIPTLIQQVVPTIPSYAEVKEYINFRINELKQQKQEAFINAQRDLVTKSESAFTARKQQITNNSRRNINRINVLGRFNNR